MSDRIVRVGDLGTAATPMCPSGLVLLDGRRIDARADGEAIPAGASVVVLRGDPTGYVVRRVGPDHPIPPLPNAGAEIVTPEFARTAAEVRRADGRDAAELRREWDRSARRRCLTMAILGAASVAVVTWWHAPDVFVSGGVGGAGLGAALALLIGRVGRAGKFSPRCADVAVIAGLVGAAVGFWVRTDANDAARGMSGLVPGGLVGLMAGWWVATRLDMVFGGPDGA